jgi:hypothetical protein
MSAAVSLVFSPGTLHATAAPAAATRVRVLLALLLQLHGLLLWQESCIASACCAATVDLLLLDGG